MFVKWLLSESGPILAVYWVRLSHTMGCPFWKNSHISYTFIKFAQVFTNFALFIHLFYNFFWKIPPMPLFSKIGPVNKYKILDIYSKAFHIKWLKTCSNQKMHFLRELFYLAVQVNVQYVVTVNCKLSISRYFQLPLKDATS